MNLKAYPLDKQTCYLRTLPYGSPVDVLEVHWMDAQPNKAVTVHLTAQ